jgi:ectoine hydroxylase-related dioxygenase (phytanoyl-CoA dioxygenase family)
MHPNNSATVWLAFDDVDEENGGMKVVPGSHLHGVIKHKRSSQTKSILSLELESGTFSEADAIQFRLKAGEISILMTAACMAPPQIPRLGDARD